MTLWRLELARLLRTYRWMILLGVYLFFGAIGPLTARYLNEIVSRFGGEVTVVAPEPRPADGIAQFIGNANQLGLLAVVVVAAGALALDARPEVAAFLRARVRSGMRLLTPRYTVTAAAAVAALVAGTAVAWVMTAALLGGLPAGALVAGTLYGGLYLAFAVAVVAAVAGFVRGQAAVVFAALGVLILLPILALVPALEPWLPSELVGAVAAMVEGTPAGEFTRATVVTVVATVALLTLAARRVERREL